MDFLNRVDPRSQPARPASTPEPVAMSTHADKSGRTQRTQKDWFVMGSHVANNVLLLCVALLIAAVAWLAYSANPASQATYVNSSKLQAVFLNTGQVYFGNIQTFNKDYLVLTNIFYLQNANSQDKNASSQVSLVKLGCELHMPYDSMVVNTAQVTFWENLQADGQVAKAVAQFDKQNPNGQKCSTTAPAASNPVQGGATTKP